MTNYFLIALGVLNGFLCISSFWAFWGASNPRFIKLEIIYIIFTFLNALGFYLGVR